MTTICACKFTVFGLLETFGDAIVAVSNGDDVLSLLVTKIKDKLYTNVVVTDVAGQQRTRRIFNYKYTWPSDVQERILNIADAFKEAYGLEIFYYEQRYYVGVRLISVEPLEITNNSIYSITNDTKQIMSAISSSVTHPSLYISSQW